MNNLNNSEPRKIPKCPARVAIKNSAKNLGNINKNIFKLFGKINRILSNLLFLLLPQMIQTKIKIKKKPHFAKKNPKNRTNKSIKMNEINCRINQKKFLSKKSKLKKTFYKT